MKEVLQKMVGKWNVTLTRDNNKSQYTIFPDGRIIVAFSDGSSREAQLEESTVTQFPLSQGWLKAPKFYRDGVWEYLRVDGDGFLATHHFCTDGPCTFQYKGTVNYFSEGKGIPIPKRKYQSSL